MSGLIKNMSGLMPVLDMNYSADIFENYLIKTLY